LTIEKLVFDKKVKFRGGGKENLLVKIALITEEYLSNAIIRNSSDGRRVKVRAMTSVVLSALMT
jgi:hypothetical protein